MLRLPLLAFVPFVLALAPRVGAQDPSQEVKEVKKQSKALLATYKQAVAQSAEVLQAQIGSFELHFADLEFSDGPVEDLVEALAGYQQAVADAQFLQAIGMEIVVGQALDNLPAGGPDDDVAPVGLVVGDGGIMDDHVAAARKIAAKACAGVNKKLAKLVTKLRKKTDMRLAFLLRPVEQVVFAPLEDSTSHGLSHTIDIDLVVAFNRGGVDNDGRIWAGGAGDVGAGDVSVTVQGDDFASASATSAGALLDRWIASTDSVADPLDEGNYSVGAAQGSGDDALEVIGLR